MTDRCPKSPDGSHRVYQPNEKEMVTMGDRTYGSCRYCGKLVLVFSVLKGQEKQQAMQQVNDALRRMFGPGPPCFFCKKESKFTIMPTPIQPKDLDDMERKMLFDSTFNAKFPLGLHVCGNCSKERKDDIDRMLPHL